MMMMMMYSPYAFCKNYYFLTGLLHSPLASGRSYLWALEAISHDLPNHTVIH
jgi:hypothetical protein